MMDKPQEENCLTPLPQEAQFDGSFWRQIIVIALAAAALLWYLSSTPTGRAWSHWTEPPPVAALSLWQPPQASPKGIAPAPTVTHGPKMKAGGKLVNSWILTDTGITAYNGTYIQGVAYNGRVTAQKSTGGVIWYFGSGYWCLSDAAGDCADAMDAPYRALVGDPEDTALPVSAWEVGTGLNPGVAPAPTIAVQPATIRIGSSESDAALWDTATEHRFSKYGPHGGYKDVSTATTGQYRTVPFQYNAPTGSTYKAVLKLDGHTWETVTGLVGDGTLRSSSFTGGVNPSSGLPYSTGEADAWDTYLGAAGSKTLTVELYRESDNVKVADDTGAYTMFVPALTVATSPATTVADRFIASLVWNEWWSGAGGTALLTVVSEGDEYDFCDGGLLLTLDGTNLVATETGDCDLAFIGTSSVVQFTYYGGTGATTGGLPEGAFTLRAQPWDSGDGEPTPVPKTDLALSHVQTYEITITAPTSGAELLPGTSYCRAYLTQGWYPDSRVSLGEVFTTHGGFDGAGSPNFRDLGFDVAIDSGMTSLTATWYYLSGEDHIPLDTDTIAITVSADGGIIDYGTGEGLPDPPVPDNPPDDPVYPPWVRWVLPPAGATVLPQFTAHLDYGNFTATAAGHLTIVAVSGAASVPLHDAAAVIGANGMLALPLDFDTAADGTYTVYVTLTGAGGESATAQATLVLAAGGSADEAAPVVTLTAPLDGATISGDTVTLTATATDAGGVWRLTWLVDGAIIGYSFAPANATSYTATWELDSTLFLNGSHVISVVARDITGNVSDPDTATVNVANTQADLTRYLYTVPLGVDTDGNPLNTQSARFLNRNKTRTIEVPILPLVADLSADPRLRYNLYFGYDEGLTATPVWSDFTLYDPLKSHTIPESKTIRWGFCAVPQQTTASFDVTCASLTRLTLAENGDPLLLAITPHSLQQFSVASGSLSQLADLSALAETPVDVAACGGKVYVAHGAKVLVIDADTGELTDDLDPDFLTSKTAITALATDGTALYVAATLTAGGSRVYKYTPEATTLYASHDYAITALAYLGSTLYAGNAQGDVLTVTASGATLAYATGEASVARLAANGSAIYAGTGTAGKLFGKLATWGLQWDSGFTALAGLSSYNGYTWAAGTGTGARYLWYEQTAGTWAQGLDTDELVTAINDLLTLEDGGHEQLFIGATRSGGTCRLYRVEMAAPATYQCGVNVPPFLGKALK